MDGDRFDDLTRRLAAGVSRRAALKGIAGGVLGAIGPRSAAAQQVGQAKCGNVRCAADPEICAPGCVCCRYANGNSRCRPPRDCSGTIATTTTTSTTTTTPTTTTAPPTTTTGAPTTTTTTSTTSTLPPSTTTTTTTTAAPPATTTTTAPPTTTTAPPCVPRTCQGEGKNCGTISDGCGQTLTCGECVRFSGRRCVDNECLCPRGNTPCPNDCSCFDVVDRDDDVCVAQLIGGIVECTSSDQCSSNEACVRILSSRPGTCNSSLPCPG